MRFSAHSLLLSLCLSASLLASEARGTDDLVTLYIPAFNGPRELGQNVATVLNLEIWRTLRKAAHEKLFGRGLVVWDTTSLGASSFEAADELARQGLDLSDGKRVYPQLVFWGNTREFGPGVVVECFLSIPPAYASSVVRDKWEVTIPHDQIELHIHADLPQRRYEFSPIVLKKELVDSYTKPTALQIYPSRDAKVPIGSVGTKFEARRQIDGWVELKSEGKVGWVPLPKLSEDKNELVDFVGGVIRIFRSDWDGAIDLFERVVKNPQAPTALKIDALLYEVLAKSKSGRDTEEHLQLAYRLSPFYRTTTVYSIMAKLEAISKVVNRPDSQKTVPTLIRQIERELNNNQALFLPDDPWLSAVSQLLNVLPYH